MPVETFPWTQFLRDPKRVTAELEHGDVVLHRRDEPDLQLSVAERSADSAESMEVASLLLQAAVSETSSRTKLLTTLRKRFAWINVLPKRQQSEFLKEFIDCAQTAGQLGNLAPLAQLLHEWKATAGIYADPYLARRLKGPFDQEGVQVPRP